MRVLRVVACVGVVFLAAACEKDKERLCTPGETQACLGAGACNGAQACSADGQGFGACDCGGPGTDGGNPDGGDPDGGNPDGGEDVCDIATQAGCEDGERCALVYAQSSASGFGCVPDGTVAAGEACTHPESGADACAGAALCHDGRCTQVCDPDGPESCGPAETCASYSYGQTDGGALAAGLCTATCDPVTQVRLTDNAAACGSADPSQPDRSCFGDFGRPFTCGPGTSRRVHGDVVNPNGEPIYLNSCAPGFLPIFFEETGSTRVVCSAMCTPVETHQGSPSGANGLSPYACADRGAVDAECRFSHYVEATPSGAGNQYGVCMDYQNHLYDDDQNAQTPMVPIPSCTALTTDDGDGDGLADHVSWGCGPRP